MKFELLPNEILIDCFEYLNALHIFHSLDQLNYYFSTLIRSVPLYVELWLILYRVLRLKYLNLQSIRRSHKDIMSRLTHDAKNRPARYLKELIVMKFECEFDNLIQILKRTPNLKSLIISSDSDMNMVDAYQWEHLITSALPYLNIFKFHF
jgi:hypothetical protein